MLIITHANISNFNISIFFLIFSFRELGVRKEIRIALLEMDRFQNELGYAKVVASLVLSNPFWYYNQGQQIL